MILVVVAPLAHRFVTSSLDCCGFMKLVVVGPLAHCFATSGLECYHGFEGGVSLVLSYDDES